MGNRIGKCPFDKATCSELNAKHIIGISILTLCAVALMVVALMWWGYQSSNIKIIPEHELRAMQEAVRHGGKHPKPKKPKKKKKPEAELDDEDLALIELDKIRQKKERDFIKKQLRPEAQHPSHLMPDI